MQYTVLVVDDEPHILQVLAFLIDLDERVTLAATAQSGQQALQHAERSCPDAIICDIRMPVMSGLEALPLLRKACPTAVIVIYSSDPHRESAMQMGADDVFDKSHDPSEVLDRVVELCRARTSGND